MPSRGELEQRVMELLWAAPGPLTVSDVQTVLQPERELAYTTVMTVLDRLAKKGLAARERQDRAWLYQPANSQVEVLIEDVTEQLAHVPADVRVSALRRVLDSLSEAERAAVLADVAATASTP